VLKGLWLFEQVVVVEVGDRDEEKMWFTLSRSLWRTFTLGLQRSCPSPEMSYAPSAVGGYLQNVFGFD